MTAWNGPVHEETASGNMETKTSGFAFPKPNSTARDWARGSDTDGQDIWVHKPTGGGVKSTAGGWRYRIGSGEWSDTASSLGVAMDRAMEAEDGWEIMRSSDGGAP
jgi:hypothetical protein